MDWLCEVTVNELVKVGKNANNMRELEAAVRKYVERRTKRRNPYDPICSECGSKSIVIIDGADTCTNCGTCDMNNFSYYVSYNYNKDDYLEKKSCHKRVRWFERHLLKHEVRCIQRLSLQRGRNIVRYKFYLLRLASMNGIELRDPPEDIRTQKIVDVLEDKLYRKVFVELGWQPENCTYYNNWKNRNT
jgi:hypothetical protein